ncbi:MAG: hypothetical protein RL380_922 [Verrucomicrobiota bacterium]
MTKPFLALAASAALAFADAPASLTVTAVNPLDLARASQTLELSAAQLAPLAAKDLSLIHVQDAAGKELIAQAVDTDFDALHKFDSVIFQSDFAAKETKTFTVSVGAKQEFTKEQFKAFGRFNRERFDDFAWENDRIAHRIYGKALETWAGEPLTSSTIDIWSKRTARMVVNDWYLADHYHHDTGEGADFYSAGKSRGCGGTGIWAADQLWVSKNFTASRVLANGPVRVLFELDYEAFDANGAKVSETKRIALDAGSQLDHLQSFYKTDAPGTLTCALGIKKVDGASVTFNAANGSLLVWEKVAKNAGQQGIALLANPKSVGQTEDKLNHLLLTKCGADNSVSYWAGFAWDKAGVIADAAAWKKYVDDFAAGLTAPIAVSVK